MSLPGQERMEGLTKLAIVWVSVGTGVELFVLPGIDLIGYMPSVTAKPDLFKKRCPHYRPNH